MQLHLIRYFTKYTYVKVYVCVRLPVTRMCSQIINYCHYNYLVNPNKIVYICSYIINVSTCAAYKLIINIDTKMFVEFLRSRES